MISGAANERIADFYTPNGALRLHQWLEPAARGHGDSLLHSLQSWLLVGIVRALSHRTDLGTERDLG
jgi:hypothetical protein